ncbi:nuclease-related domain-containing protein [Sediminibacillus massiliensis]|uniref:nuclease-related domain-containing protein n=1 Tax=Sediminibacillus massiliensis TaxID=1926277 RepID=UPI00098874D0|nr:nuclease-related domain-containing protein [Sediminibacillus massiliensis]
MAQLIKLLNYLSRYEQDIYHYPGQFIRLKRQQWKHTVNSWENQKYHEAEDSLDEEDTSEGSSSWLKLFKRKAKPEEAEEVHKTTPPLPMDKQELKRHFLDNLLPFQLKWASTTISRMSFLDRDYFTDPTLIYFLQRFPDTYLVMYDPLFQLKKSTVEGDIILLHPQGLDIVRVIKAETGDKFIASAGRTWEIQGSNGTRNMLSPLISLRRTEQVINSVLDLYGIEFPVRKVVISQINKIDFESEPYNTRYIGADQHAEWLQYKQKEVSPLKHRQLKVGEALLKHCQSISVKRPEWDQDGGLSFE